MNKLACFGVLSGLKTNQVAHNNLVYIELFDSMGRKKCAIDVHLVTYMRKGSEKDIAEVHVPPQIYLQHRMLYGATDVNRIPNSTFKLNSTSTLAQTTLIRVAS